MQYNPTRVICNSRVAREFQLIARIKSKNTRVSALSCVNLAVGGTVYYTINSLKYKNLTVKLFRNLWWLKLQTLQQIFAFISLDYLNLNPQSNISGVHDNI